LSPLLKPLPENLDHRIGHAADIVANPLVIALLHNGPRWRKQGQHAGSHLLKVLTGRRVEPRRFAQSFTHVDQLAGTDL